MKKIGLLFLLLIITSMSYAKITLVSFTGYVQIKPNESADWATPKAGSLLDPGYIIYTGFNSSAVIDIENARVDIKPLTQINISSLIVEDKKVTTDIYLKYGKIKAEVNTNKETRTLFKVRSANSTASVRGTVFTFGEDNLYVEEGTVHLLSSNGLTALVQKNEKAESSKLNFIKSPQRIIKTDAIVNIQPVGISDQEVNRITPLTVEKISTEAKIILLISVVQ